MKYRKTIKENHFIYINNINNTRRSILQLQIRNKGKVSCPAPHPASVIPKDINLSDIFNQMLKTSNEIYDHRNNPMYVKLSQDQTFHRKMLLESIKTFVSQNQIKNKLLYNIIFLFDLLMAKNAKKKLTNTIEKLGLGSTILMVKFNYEGNRIIAMKKYRSVFKNKYYSSRDIKEIEFVCLYLCDYNLLFPSPIAFMEVFLLNRIISYQDDIKKESKKRINNLIMNTLEKIMFESNEYIKYNPLYLCCCIIYYIREMFGLEKWPRILANLFNTNSKAFEVVYNEYFKANKNKENNRNNNYDSCNNNNISTNIDSHGNISSSNRNEKNKVITEIKVRNPIFNNINNFNKEKEKELNFHKIGIKKINLHINSRILNTIVNSEKKRRKYKNSVYIIIDKRDKEKYFNRQEDYSFINKNKSNLENSLNNYQKSLYNNYECDNSKLLSSNNLDNYNNYKENKNYNIQNNKIEPRHNIKTIYLNNHNLQTLTKNEIIKENEQPKLKEPIKNIKVSLRPFLQKNLMKSYNKNLDKFINTESNMNQFFMKTNNIKYNEIKNLITANKNDYLIYKNDEILNYFNVDNNKNKRYSSCDKCYGEVNNYKYNATLEKEYRNIDKNFSIRRNYCHLQKLSHNLNNKPHDMSEENDSLIKNSILCNDNQFKKPNEKEVYPTSKSIEAIPRSIRIYNLKRYKNNNNNNENRINSIIFEKSKDEQQENDEQIDYMFKTLNSKNSENKNNHRLNSIERFYESKIYEAGIDLNDEDNENGKNSNIRNYYKQKHASTNKIIDKSSNIVL